MQTMDAHVEELVNCPICLDKMTRPKMLPCQHCFCFSCLLNLVPSNNGPIDCPQCRVRHRIPRNGIEGFSDNYLINNLLGILDLGIGKKTCSYCENEVKCEGTVCSSCLDDPRLPVTENIHCTVTSIRSHISDPKTITALARNESFLEGISEDLVRERARMEKVFDEMITSLQQRKASLNDSFQKGETIQKLVQNFMADPGTLAIFCKQITDQVGSKPGLEELKRIEEKCSQYDQWYKLIFDTTRNKKKLTFVYNRPNEGDGDLDAAAVKEWMRTIGVFTNGTTNFGDHIDENMTSSNGNVETICAPTTGIDRERIVDGASTASNTPLASTSIDRNSSQSANGTTSATAKPGSSKRVDQAPTPTANLNPVKYHAKSLSKAQCLRPQSVSVRFGKPTGLTYSARDDTIFCAEYDHNRVVKIVGTKSVKRTLYSVFGTANLTNPFDVAVSEFHNSVVVSDSGSHRIVCFDTKGNQKFTAGSFGRGKDKFQYPSGIAIYRDHILVVDRGNHRISIFSIRDGSFVRNFGQKYLNFPHYITVSSSGEMYVSDFLSTDEQRLDGVRIFDWNGRLLREVIVHSRRNDDTDDLHAAGITVDKEGFLCAATPTGLIVSGPQGNVITTIKNKLQTGISKYGGLELLPDGRLLVCDAHNGQLLIL